MLRSLAFLLVLTSLSSAQTPTTLETLTGDDGVRLGWAVSGAGDVDGDGTVDYVVGEPRNDTVANSAGRVAAGPGGALSAGSNWPLGVPSGVPLTFQFLVQDASVGFGVTLSNGLRGTTP